MNTISKERRDAIRAAAEKATPGPWEVGPVDDTVVTHLGADGLRYEIAGIDGDYNSPDEWPTMEANAAHIANCDPQTILALLDALDAAEKAEPVAWMVRGHLRDGTAVLRLPVLTSREDADRYAACNPDYTLAPLYTHPAPAVREGWASIYVGQGQYAICDWQDWPTVRGYWWRMSTKKAGWGTRYAQAHDSHDTASRKRITMHGLIMQPPEGMIVDHINGDGLDNRRENLRLATFAQNSYNKSQHKGSSKYKGVTYVSENSSWRAYITKDGKRINLGTFASEDDAAICYNRAAQVAFGEFAKLNDVAAAPEAK